MKTDDDCEKIGFHGPNRIISTMSKAALVEIKNKNFRNIKPNVCRFMILTSSFMFSKQAKTIKLEHMADH